MSARGKQLHDAEQWRKGLIDVDSSILNHENPTPKNNQQFSEVLWLLGFVAALWLISVIAGYVWGTLITKYPNLIQIVKQWFQ